LRGPGNPALVAAGLDLDERVQTILLREGLIRATEPGPAGDGDGDKERVQ
jgi:hypothetical protein